MELKNILAGAAIFGAGVLLSGRVKHATANFFAEEPLPYVAVNYEKNGAFVNGQPVLGERIGAARCDFSELETTAQDSVIQYALHADKRFMAQYVRDLSTRDQMNMVYTGLTQLARKAGTSVGEEAERMKDAVGFRWGLQYKQTGENPFPIIER